MSAEKRLTAALEAPQKRAQLSAVVPPPLVTPSQIAALAREQGLEVLASLPTSPPVNFSGTLLHPWSLRRSTRGPTQSPAVGLILPEFHLAFPWSEQRWRFVLMAMRECCESVWIVGEGSVLVPGTISVTRTLNPHYADFIEAFVAAGATAGATAIAAPRAFIDPDKLHRSFSSFWHLASKEKFPQ